MADRLIEVFVPADRRERVDAVVTAQDLPWSVQRQVQDLVVFRLLLPAGRVESVLDALADAAGGSEGFRAIVLPVVATLPRIEEPPPEEGREPEPDRGRVSREELHAALEPTIRVGPEFLVACAIAALVACIGLAQDSAAVVIGAMVIAPLLGPNMALALGTTLGNASLAWQALKANGAGLVIVLAVSAASAFFLDVDPSSHELALRAETGWGDLVLPLAAGVAGVLAFTSGVAAALVGVMVAVALVPPLAAAALFLAGGFPVQAREAFLLLGVNVVCVNLAGVATFLARGIRPHNWWEMRKASRLARLALCLWVALLAALVVLVALSRLGDGPA